jgi:DNA-binding CsgD family transcriptional regulator
MLTDCYIILHNKGYVTVTEPGLIINSDNAGIIGLTLRELNTGCARDCEKCLSPAPAGKENNMIRLDCFSKYDYFTQERVEIGGSVHHILRLHPEEKTTIRGTGIKSPLVMESGAFVARYVFGSFSIIFCNDRFASLTGKEPGSVIHRSIFDFIPQDETEIVLTALNAVSLPDTPLSSCEHTIVNSSDNSEHLLFWYFSAIRNGAAGHVAAVDVCGIDISNVSVPKKKIIAMLKDVLSPQEYKVLMYASHLNSRKATARTLAIDEKTYDTYLERAKKKIHEKEGVIASAIMRLLNPEEDI